MQPLMHINDILDSLRSVSKALDTISEHLEQLPRYPDVKRLDREWLAFRRQLARVQRAALDTADSLEAELDQED